MANKVLKPTAARLDIVVEQGATFDVEVEWTDEEEDLIPLEDAKAILQVREYADATHLLFEMTTEDGRIILGNGTIRLLIPRDITATLDFESGRYNLEIERKGKTTRVFKGKFIVDKEIIEEE